MGTVLKRQRINVAVDHAPIVGGLSQHPAVSRQRDERDVVGRRQLRDEVLGRLLRGVQTGGVDVGCLHRLRQVEHQHHGGALAGHLLGACRARPGTGDRRQGAQRHRDRNVPAPLRLPGQHRADDAGLGVAHAAVALQPQQQDVGDHQHRQHEQGPQPFGIEELPQPDLGGIAGHLVTPCGG
ncbi:hypothetical protein SDC9_155913 [bioreactor metagenome]|uniref:Uncharacterized protein n=1 Tax=bioreactor metagenome TaxID=1076179 RepID=A0A645F2S6_9ZZZZ